MHAVDKLRILLIRLSDDLEFEDAVRSSDKFGRLRAYFEDRLAEKSLDRDIIEIIPSLYMELKRFNDVRHVVPRSESRKISGIPQMAAEVIVQFTTFKV